MSSLLSARGQRMVELGGERSWLERTKGDIGIIFQWLEIPGKKEPQPVMALFPLILKLDGGAYVIPQDNAYEYADSKGEPTPYLLTAAFNAAQTMGFFPDQSTVFRIVDIIVESLPDLIRMPSDQPERLNVERPTMGIEATAKVNGQTIHEEIL